MSRFIHVDFRRAACFLVVLGNKLQLLYLSTVRMSRLIRAFWWFWEMTPVRKLWRFRLSFSSQNATWMKLASSRGAANPTAH